MRSVSSACSAGVVVLAHGCGDPSLCEQAGRGQKRPLREDEHIALARGAERSEEAGDTATHDDERKLADLYVRDRSW